MAGPNKVEQKSFLDMLGGGESVDPAGDVTKQEREANLRRTRAKRDHSDAVPESRVLTTFTPRRSPDDPVPMGGCKDD